MIFAAVSPGPAVLMSARTGLTEGFRTGLMLAMGIGAGAVAIDNSSAFRMDSDVPLVVPEINPQAAKNHPRNIIANPNCSTIIGIVPVWPLHKVNPVKRMIVSTTCDISIFDAHSVQYFRCLFNLDPGSGAIQGSWAGTWWRRRGSGTSSP